jgi:hypothetical protein
MGWPRAYSSPKEIQIDAISGKVLNKGLRGDQLWMDVHSFLVFGDIVKYTAMILSGITLFWLILTGYYLFFYPYWVKARKARRVPVSAAADQGLAVDQAG